jgi:hypothetical protein
MKKIPWAKLKKTALALGIAVALIVAWEMYGVNDPNDDVVTITEFMRSLPPMAIAAVSLTIGVLFGHFWWR